MGNSMAFSTLIQIPLISSMPESQKPEKRGQSNRMYSENDGYIKVKGPRPKDLCLTLFKYNYKTYWSEP